MPPLFPRQPLGPAGVFLHIKKDGHNDDAALYQQLPDSTDKCNTTAFGKTSAGDLKPKHFIGIALILLIILSVFFCFVKRNT
jgi:hypothetical protein